MQQNNVTNTTISKHMRIFQYSETGVYILCKYFGRGGRRGMAAGEKIQMKVQEIGKK